MEIFLILRAYPIRKDDKKTSTGRYYQFIKHFLNV